MSERVLSNWGEWRTQYLNFLRNEENVTTAREYVESYGKEDLSEGSELTKILDELGSDLSGFERIYPAYGQDLAVVMINPNLSIGQQQSYRDDDNYRISQQDLDDYSARAEVSIDATLGWFNSSRGTGKPNRVGEAAYRLGIIDEPMTKPFSRDFFSHVYYTDWYKFATAGNSLIPKSLREDCEYSFPSEMLRAELAEVEPELVLAFGRHPWRALRLNCEPIKSDSPTGRSVRAAEGNAYQFNDNESEFYLFPLDFQKASKDALKSAFKQLPGL